MLLLRSREPLERVEDLGAHTRLARQRVGDPRGDELLGEDHGDALALDEVGEVGEPLRVGFGVGRQPGDALLLQAVAAREVAERLVRGHDELALAVCEPV